MSEKLIEDWESPIKHKMRSAGATFMCESAQVRTNLASEQKDRELRTRVTIKRLLESEAERNEELAEDTFTIEKQLKSLISLLVEKDEKLKVLERVKPDKKLLVRLGAGCLFSVFCCVRKRLVAESFAVFQRIMEERVRADLNLKLIGNRLKSCFSKGFGVRKMYFKILFRNFKVITETLNRKMKEYLKILICRKSSIGYDKAMNAIKMLFLKERRENRILGILHSFKIWKLLMWAEMYKKKRETRRLSCYMLQNIFQRTLKKRFFRFTKQVTELIEVHLKESHKSYLQKFENTSQKEISFRVLEFILRKHQKLSLIHFFHNWCNILKKTNKVLLPLHSSLLKPLRRIFQAIINRPQKFKLWKSLKTLFLKQKKTALNILSRRTKKLVICSLQKQIEENFKLSLDLKDSNEKLASNSIFLTSERSSLKHQSLQISSELVQIEESLNNLESYYTNLMQKANSHIKELESYTRSSAATTKYSDQINSLQIKAQKQQTYIETAGSKLQQLVHKHELLNQENSTIIAKNDLVQQALKKIHENYSKILEEIRPSNDSKSDIHHLSQTLSLLGEEISSLKFRLKSESADYKSAKVDVVNKSQELQHRKEKILQLEENVQKTLKQIAHIEEDLLSEVEAKDFKLQEVNSEIESIKQQINKSREDIENLRIQLKETSAKVKYPAKLPEELQTASKTFEVNKKKLSSLRETVGLNTSTFASYQKEVTELRHMIRNKKDEFDKKKIENSFLENKIALAELSFQESQKQGKLRQRSKADLEIYVKTLEQQVSRLNEAVLKQNNQDLSMYNNENAALAQKVEKLERELEFFNEEAAQRRREVAQVKPEIDNYRIILAAMEEKIAENELRVRETETERDKLRAEGKILKDRFLSLSHPNFK